MTRQAPVVGSPQDVFQTQVQDLINKDYVFTTAPTLEAMEIGEGAYGDGTESSPSANSDALYFKPDADKIVVISFDGTTFATRYIVATGATAPNANIPQMKDIIALMEQLLMLVSLANQHLKLITENDLQPGETL